MLQHIEEIKHQLESFKFYILLTSNFC